jgi:prolyl oligopeptidase
MTKYFVVIFLLSPFFGLAQLKYPKAKKGDMVDNYFGTINVSDPYRWMEDNNSEETKAWVKAENKVTFDYLGTLPDRTKINTRLKELWNYTKYSSPVKKDNYYYYYKNIGLQNQSVLYRQLGFTGKPEICLMHNKSGIEGIAAIENISFSKSGKYLTYTVSVAGSDWKIGYIMETATRKLLKDKIQWIKSGSFSWKNDEGFYYSGYTKQDSISLLSNQTRYNKLFYHKLGTPQSTDELIYQDMENPFIYCNGSLTEDGRYLIAQISDGNNGSEIYFIDNKNPEQHRFKLLIRDFKTAASFIDNQEGELLIRTNDNAPNYKVIRMKAKSEGEEEGLNTKEQEMEIIIPEKDMVLQNVSTCGGYLFAAYLKDASTKVYQYTYDGKLIREIKLPGIGTAIGFSGEKKDKELFYTFSSFNTPPQTFRYDIATGKSTIFHKTAIKINTADFVTEQVFFSSSDGTKIPMFLTYKKGMQLNANNPTVMFGYGGFNITLTPGFSISNAFFVEQGGIYAVVNVRGGGEYGEKWHQAGMLDKKQNVFDDFVYAAEYLIQRKYTNKAKIAIKGSGHGGLLVGAVITQRPDICRVALPAQGIMDMLRFHRFTVGNYWVSEYGCADSVKDFHNLYRYSPYHNFNEGTRYPATLVTTGDNDGRMVPAHSFKFAARLQEYNTGDNPVLIRIETNAGDGTGKSTTPQIEEATDEWSFVMHHLEMPFKKQAELLKPVKKK